MSEREPETKVEPTHSPDDVLFTISRRELLAGGALVAVSAAIGFGLSKIQNNELSIPEVKLPNVELQSNPEGINGTIELGDEVDLDLRDIGVSWAPDGHIPYVTFPDGERKYFVSGNAKCYVIESNTPVEIEEAIKSGEKAKLVIGPDSNPKYSNHRGEVAYRNGYTAITTVLQTEGSNPNHLIGFTHNEEWMAQGNGHNFTASISMVESMDGGETWSERLLMTGDEPSAPGGERVQGVGQPHAIIKDNDVYLYYIDWMAYKRGVKEDQLYLAKFPINQNGTLGEIAHYTENGFTKEYKPASLKSVLPKPQNIPGAVYSALPSVSFNTYLDRFLCVFEVDKDAKDTLFCMATSEDGINWSDAKVIFSRNAIYKDNKTEPAAWNSYPTLLSDSNQDSDQFTDQTGNLYYAKSRGAAHNLVKRPYKIV